MRVAFLTHNFPRHDGDLPGSFLLRLAVALRTVDVEVKVFAPAAPGYASDGEIDGVVVERFRYAPRHMETLAYTGAMAETARASWRGGAALLGLVGASARAARRARRRWKADVVHAHWWFPSGVAAALPLTTANVTPLVVTLHGSDVRLATRVRSAHAAFARVVARASAVTAVSRWLCDRAREMVPTLACEVAPMPVATDLFAPPAPGADARRGLLFVGRLNRQKGLEDLLRAMSAQSRPSELTVVGDGPDADALRALASELAIERRVSWHPAVTQQELARFYTRAEAVAMPSVDEGLGLVAVEAMLCGTPVVAYASGGLPEVVRDGETGWLVPPHDVPALARALDSATRPDEAARRGRIGANVTREAFAPHAVAERYRAIYDGARGRAARPSG